MDAKTTSMHSRGGNLTEEEHARFLDLGFHGPVAHPLLAPGSPLVDTLIERFSALEATTAMPTRPDLYRKRLDDGLRWWRGMHLEISELWQVARHPALRDPLRSILGPNIVWGGAFLTSLGAGERHGWHFDSEFHHDPGVVVFLAMRNVNERAAVSVIARSHHIGEQPSAYLTQGVRGDLAGGRLSDDRAVFEVAKQKRADAELIVPPMTTGDFLITDGRMWHGVFNETDQPRRGMVFFFAKPSTRFRISLTGDASPNYHDRDVPVAMLEGAADGAANIVVAPPVGA